MSAKNQMSNTNGDLAQTCTKARRLSLSWRLPALAMLKTDARSGSTAKAARSKLPLGVPLSIAGQLRRGPTQR